MPPVEAALEEQALGDRIEGMMQSLSCADQVEVVEVAVACVFRNRKDRQGFRATMATLFSTLAKKLAEQERWEEENDEGKEGDEARLDEGAEALELLRRSRQSDCDCFA